MSFSPTPIPTTSSESSSSEAARTPETTLLPRLITNTTIVHHADKPCICCVFHSEEKTSIIWYFQTENHRIESSQKYVVTVSLKNVIRGGKPMQLYVALLCINDIGINDQGEYRCFAENKHGIMNVHLKLLIGLDYFMRIVAESVYPAACFDASNEVELRENRAHTPTARLVTADEKWIRTMDGHVELITAGGTQTITEAERLVLRTELQQYYALHYPNLYQKWLAKNTIANDVPAYTNDMIGEEEFNILQTLPKRLQLHIVNGYLLGDSRLSLSAVRALRLRVVNASWQQLEEEPQKFDPTKPKRIADTCHVTFKEQARKKRRCDVLKGQRSFLVREEARQRRIDDWTEAYESVSAQARKAARIVFAPRLPIPIKGYMMDVKRDRNAVGVKPFKQADSRITYRDKTLRVQAFVGGDPTPNAVWLADGKVIENAENAKASAYKIYVKTAERYYCEFALTLSKVEMQDLPSLVTCKVFNAFGGAQLDIAMEKLAHDRISFVYRPVVRCKPGTSTFLLYCRISVPVDNSCIDVAWSRNGAKLPQNRFKRIVERAADGSIVVALQIEAGQKRSRSAKVLWECDIRCKRLDEEELCKPLRATWTTQLPASSGAPSVPRPPRVAVQTVKGPPDTLSVLMFLPFAKARRWRWFNPRGRKLQPGGRIRMEKGYDDDSAFCSLRIDRVVPVDAGTYTCRLTNEKGNIDVEFNIAFTAEGAVEVQHKEVEVKLEDPSSESSSDSQPQEQLIDLPPIDMNDVLSAIKDQSILQARSAMIEWKAIYRMQREAERKVRADLLRELDELEDQLEAKEKRRKEREAESDEEMRGSSPE